MLVGQSLGGKTTAWTILTRAMGRLHKKGELANDGSPFQQVRTLVINPKAVPSSNLYGEYDLQTFEWTDGDCRGLRTRISPACMPYVPCLRSPASMPPCPL
jgi:hypothetical protein